MLLAIAIVSLIGSVLGLINFAVKPEGDANDWIHIVTVMAWWTISLAFAITWGAFVLLFIIVVVFLNK